MSFWTGFWTDLATDVTRKGKFAQHCFVKRQRYHAVMVEVSEQKKEFLFYVREINKKPMFVQKCGLVVLSERVGLKLKSGQTWDNKSICIYSPLVYPTSLGLSPIWIGSTLVRDRLNCVGFTRSWYHPFPNCTNK